MKNVYYGKSTNESKKCFLLKKKFSFNSIFLEHFEAPWKLKGLEDRTWFLPGRTEKRGQLASSCSNLPRHPYDKGERAQGTTQWPLTSAPHTQTLTPDTPVSGRRALIISLIPIHPVHVDQSTYLPLTVDRASNAFETQIFHPKKLKNSHRKTRAFLMKTSCCFTTEAENPTTRASDHERLPGHLPFHELTPARKPARQDFTVHSCFSPATTWDSRISTQLGVAF